MYNRLIIFNLLSFECIGNGFSHLGVTVNDLEEMHKICKASSYETGELRGLSGGTPSYFFVTDPDGYRIEVKRKH